MTMHILGASLVFCSVAPEDYSLHSIPALMFSIKKIAKEIMPCIILSQKKQNPTTVFDFKHTTFDNDVISNPSAIHFLVYDVRFTLL